jgi:hypothetical protein
MNSRKHPLRNKKWLFIPLGIVLILFFITFTVGKKQSVPSQPSPLLPKTITFSKYNTTKQQPITQWKTYTNKTYGFSLKYPAFGYTQDPTCFTKGSCKTLTLTSCGTDIHLETNSEEKIIYIDKLIAIFIQPATIKISPMKPSYSVKKGTYTFTLLPLQNAGSKTGCLPPVGTNGNVFQSKYWNIPKSFSFIK